MGRFWCSVIKLSGEGLILIKSEAAALVQSLTQLELLRAGKGVEPVWSGVAGSRDGVQPVPDPSFIQNSSSLALLSLLHSQMCIYTYLYIVISTEGNTGS